MKPVKRGFLSLVFLSLVLCVAHARADGSDADQQRQGEKLRALNASLRPRTGDIHIPGANTTLHIGKAYYFLGPEDAKRVLTEAWGNPPDVSANVLGLVFPNGRHFYDGSWGAVVTYEATGYVSDVAQKPDEFNKLIDKVHEGESESNAELQKKGFATQHLVGWAQPPSYDAAAHSMIWARDIKFSDQPADTLNYDVRLLGRRGVLSLNMVASMPQIADVRAAAATLANTAAFDPGSRYADFQSGDAKAEYGLAGLVAAGLGVVAAKKLGVLALLAVFGKKLFLVIAAGFAALWARFRKMLGLKPKAAAAAAADEPPVQPPLVS